MDAAAVGVAGEAAGPNRREVGLAEADAARGRVEQAIDQAHERGLATARFAHQPDRLAPADGEAHLVDRVQQSLAADVEAFGQLADFEQIAIKPEVRPLILKENAVRLLGLDAAGS